MPKPANPLDNRNIGPILLKGHYVSSSDMEKAADYAQSRGGSITDYLLSEGILTKKLLGQAVAEHFGVPYADLQIKPPDKNQILKIDKTFADFYNAVVYEETSTSVTVATSNPEAPDLSEKLQVMFPKRKILIAYATRDDIRSFFTAYEEPLVVRIIEAIGIGGKVAPEILSQIVSEALTLSASDIHFEPQDADVLVRLRIDGVLHIIGKIPKVTYENIVTRIKILARLRIDEHYTMQDGAIRWQGKDGTQVDMRISIIPTLDGETVAIRLLLSYIKSLALEELGLSEAHRKMLIDASKRPFGMILVTGPTGSGKTTTLYALIKLLNNPDVNITTIEDPVEYKLARVNQIQVNPATNITFAKGLRSIIRQDPNIILVGEIRDVETAEIAVNAALTGHLLFSTFHANDAATTIPRLLAMGIEPFMLASTLELIIAQRLVRKICESCRHSFTVNEKELIQKYPGIKKILGNPKTLYIGKGCPACKGTGYKGRTAIFEMIQVSSSIRDLILSNPSFHQVSELAKKEGMTTLIDDGLAKVKSGITTIEEVVRVAGVPVK